MSPLRVLGAAVAGQLVLGSASAIASPASLPDTGDALVPLEADLVGPCTVTVQAAQLRQR